MAAACPEWAKTLIERRVTALLDTGDDPVDLTEEALDPGAYLQPDELLIIGRALQTLGCVMEQGAKDIMAPRAMAAPVDDGRVVWRWIAPGWSVDTARVAEELPPSVAPDLYGPPIVHVLPDMVRRDYPPAANPGLYRIAASGHVRAEIKKERTDDYPTEYP